MKQNNSFMDALGAANSGKRYPVMKLLRDDPGIAAVVSKLIMGNEPPMYDSKGNREVPNMNYGVLKNASNKIADNTRDALNTMQLLPDIKLAATILVTSVLSPKDMMTLELTHSAAEGLVPPDINAALIAETKKHFEQVYKIDTLLPKMLWDALFEKGSFPIAVIPENSLDAAINGVQKLTMESLRDSIREDGTVRSLGILGPSIVAQPQRERVKVGLATEVFNQPVVDKRDYSQITFECIFGKEKEWKETFLTVNDNPDVLKIPEISARMREQNIAALLKRKGSAIGMESSNLAEVKYNDRNMTGLMYSNKNFNFKPVNVILSQDQLTRRSVGSPLVLHLPPESVIPVFVPGSPEKQIGFFVLLDADGHPLARTPDVDYYNQISGQLNSQGSFPSAMLNHVNGMMNGYEASNRDHLDFTTRAFGTMIEQELLARLRNGVYGNDVQVGKQEEIYRIMLARAMSRQHTQLLFLPAELMTYVAFNYTQEGVGKSILEDMKVLNSMRAMLLFANTNLSLKNSIGRTGVNLKLDEDDPNPRQALEIAMDEFLRSRHSSMPIGRSNPSDIVDWLSRAGYEFTYEGHPGLPDVKIDVTEKNSNYAKPDLDLMADLKKTSIMGVGINPETVDASERAEFATSIVNNNLLLAKRVMQIQDQFTPFVSDHFRKMLRNTESLLKKLRDILEANFEKLNLELTEEGKKLVESKDKDAQYQKDKAKDETIELVLMEFIGTYEVTLPKPNSVTLENQMAALDTYMKALDVAFDAVLSEKFFGTEVGGDVAQNVSQIKEVVKAYFIRKFMNDNGILPELNVLTTKATDGSTGLDLWEIQTTHIAALTDTLTKFMKGLQPSKDAGNAVMGELNVDTSGNSGSDDSGNSDDSGGGNDEFSFDDTSPDLGGSDDSGGTGTETPPDENASGSEAPEDKSLNADVPPDEEDKKDDKTKDKSEDKS